MSPGGERERERGKSLQSFKILSLHSRILDTKCRDFCDSLFLSLKTNGFWNRDQHRTMRISTYLQFLISTATGNLTLLRSYLTRTRPPALSASKKCLTKKVGQIRQRSNWGVAFRNCVDSQNLACLCPEWWRLVGDGLVGVELGYVRGGKIGADGW